MIPRYGEWDKKYGPAGLAVVGVHTPETDAEYNEASVRDYVKNRQISWPVALDPYYTAWRRYHIEAWPTIVLIDRHGVVRMYHPGKMSYEELRAQLDKLIAAT